MPTASRAAVGTSELKAISWLTHWSYTSGGPPSRRTKSSIQSVTGQPVAASDAMPAHHGLWPESAAIVSDRVVSSSSVVGTSQPFASNSCGEYQTSDFTLAPEGAA